MSEKTEPRGLFFIALTAAFWSIGGLLIKLIPWNAVLINGGRSAIAAVVLAVYLRRVRVHVNLPVILGALSISSTNILYVLANKMTTAANAIVLQYTAPMFVLILSAVLYKKRPSLFQTITVLAAFSGIILTFFDGIGSGRMAGNLIALLSGLTFSGVFFSNHLPDARPADASYLACLINVIATLPFVGSVTPLSVKQTLALLALGSLQIGLAYVFFSIGIKRCAPVTASLMGMLEALLNPIWVLLIVGEYPSLWTIAGGVIVLGAIAANTVYETRRSRAEAQRALSP